MLVENELKKLQTFDSIYFRSKSHFEENATQNYLVFQPMYRYFKRVSGVGKGNHIYFWKSKGLSDENITLPATIDYSITPKLGYFGTKTRAEFNGSCLKQDEITYNHGKMVNVYIVYEINKNYDISSYPTHLLKMFILISINILGMVLDLTDLKDFFQKAMELVRM